MATLFASILVKKLGPLHWLYNICSAEPSFWTLLLEQRNNKMSYGGIQNLHPNFIQLWKTFICLYTWICKWQKDHSSFFFIFWIYAIPQKRKQKSEMQRFWYIQTFDKQRFLKLLKRWDCIIIATSEKKSLHCKKELATVILQVWVELIIYDDVIYEDPHGSCLVHCAKKIIFWIFFLYIFM